MAKSKYEKVKDYFDRELWNISRVKDSVKKDWITPGQFLEITGQVYLENEEETT